jgi:hypothetical protein
MEGLNQEAKAIDRKVESRSAKRDEIERGQQVSSAEIAKVLDASDPKITATSLLYCSRMKLGTAIERN